MATKMRAFRLSEETIITIAELREQYELASGTDVVRVALEVMDTVSTNSPQLKQAVKKIKESPAGKRGRKPGSKVAAPPASE